MFYPNGFLYFSLFPIIYQVKLNIELGLSELIVKVASEKSVHRINKDMKLDDEGHFAGRINVAIEENIEAHQGTPLNILPTFGRHIKRPEWADKISSKSSTAGVSTGSMDEEATLGSGEKQSASVHFEDEK